MTLGSSCRSKIQSKIRAGNWPIQTPPAFRFVEDLRHKSFVGNIPFTLDSILARRFESESGIIFRVAHNNDEWIARIFDFPALQPSDPRPHR